MRRVAVINQKGGVGKTTTTAHLGAALALTGRRVLLIDLDPQAHLSLHFGIEVAEDQSSIYDVLTASLPIREAMTVVHGSLHLVPSDIDLAAAEAELISVMGREVILREALDVVDDEFDVLLIDCPPSLGVLTINALSACHEVVIPLQAQFFALQGLGKLLDTVMLVQQRINPSIVVKGVALCMHDSSTKLSNEIVDDLTDFLASSRDSKVPWSEAEIFKTRIRRNVKIAESSSFGQTVFEYEPRSNGAIDYNRLAIDIFNSPCVPGLEDTLPKAVEKVVDEKAAVDKNVADKNLVENAQVNSIPKTVEGECQAEVVKSTEIAKEDAVNPPDVAVEASQPSSVEPSIENSKTTVNGVDTVVPIAAQNSIPVDPATTPELSTPTKTTEPAIKAASVGVDGLTVLPPATPPSSPPETVVSSA